VGVCRNGSPVRFLARLLARGSRPKKLNVGWGRKVGSCCKKKFRSLRSLEVLFKFDAKAAGLGGRLRAERLTGLSRGHLSHVCIWSI